MQGVEFRGLAEAVARAYGDDPWFFLRELAQNSRDAGAGNVWVSASAANGTETLAFVDDGGGMTLEHARRFLFRLYASDKGSDLAAAGRYGVGFWTVLRFRPDVLRIESRRGGAAWALELDGALNARPAACGLEGNGTAVTLTRSGAGPPVRFAAEVEAGLKTYCRYLRRNDRRGSPLALWFSGRNLVEPMSLPGPLSLSFRDGSVEGAVGLGEKPLVRLFARGLPVWEGALLSQMSHLQADPELRAEIASGLAPVFLLNGNRLDVTFSRRLAVENKELERMRRKAEKALHRLLESSLETAFPRRWGRRWATRLGAALGRLRRPGWYWIPAALMLLLALEWGALRLLAPRSAGAAAYGFGLGDAPLSYRGLQAGAPAAATPPPFSYLPAEPALFRLFTADRYDEQDGFQRRPEAGRRLALPPASCPVSAAMAMRLRAEAGMTLLPLPPGHQLASGSLRFNGRSLGPVFLSDLGETLVELPAAGMVEYRSCPWPGPGALSPDEFSRFTRLGNGAVLPAALEASAAAARRLPVRERLALAMALTREAIAYDASPGAADRYRALSAAGSWPARVLAAGRGDCDALNGFLVLLLRKMEVPSRLVIGMIGEMGGIRPALHAWCEYFDDGWWVGDATAGASPQAPAPARNRPLPAPGRTGRAHHPPYLLFALLLAAALGILVLWQRRGSWRMTAGATAGEQAGPLMQIVQHALVEPAAWGEQNPLWRHPLLPLLGGGLLSLRQAELRQRRGRLFATVNRNPLAAAMSRSGIPVLDLGSPPHALLQPLLPGAVDVDRLCRLRPQPPALEGLLAEVNALGRGRDPFVPCLAAPGLDWAEALPVSLPARLSSPPFYFPRRFIAVNPRSRLFARCSALYPQNPALAVLRLLRGLADGPLADSPFAAPAAVKRAARRLLRRAHG